MIQIFRKFFQSKFGIAVTLAFLGVIAVAFASSDVANTGMFGGVAGGDRVANVGDRTITTAELIQNANTGLQQSRTENAALTMEGFVAQGGLDDIIDQMLSRWSIVEFAENLGLRASERTVNSELRAVPLFNGLNGEFDPEIFRNWVRQQNLTEERVLEDLAMGIYAQQLILPVSYATGMPESLAQRYAALTNETRTGSAIGLTAAAFAPDGAPADAELQGYYQANRARYVRPERRVIRYAAFGEEAISEIAPVTAQQIERRYQRDTAVYAATEERSFTRLVVPTEAAAQAVIDEVGGGMSLEVSARSKGLDTVAIDEVDRAALQSQTSEAVAEAAFSAAQGALVGPVRGDLGWFVLRVDDVNQISGQTLAQASETIRTQLTEERRILALNELTERLEDELRDRSLSEVTQELGLEITETPAVTATGQIYGTQETAPPVLARVIDFAFDLDEGDPQLAELVPGQQFLLFDVARITPSAAAPLAEIRDQVTSDWRREQGMAGAGAAARRVIERVEGGMSLADAVAEEEVGLGTPEALRLNRRELAEQGQLSRASILFFSMAEGTTKRVELNNASMWYVVQLDEIEMPELAEDDPVYLQTRQQLSAAMGEEYVAQLVAGLRNTTDIETNDVAIEAVRAQLLGLNN